LHTAVGPIEGWEDSVEVARQLTEAGDCTFMPVELQRVTKVPLDKPGEDTGHAGQYL
jgi:hypothetical protein